MVLHHFGNEVDSQVIGKRCIAQYGVVVLRSNLVKAVRKSSAKTAVIPLPGLVITRGETILLAWPQQPPLCVLVVEMSQITPPVGFNLFVIQSLTGKNIIYIARAALPFFFMIAIAIVLITIYPSIALYLPTLMNS